MNDSLILLDPFRSALVCQAIEDKIITTDPSIDFRDTIPFRLGADFNLRKQVMQLCILYPEIKLIQYEESLDKAKKEGIIVQSLDPLRKREIVTFSKSAVNPARLEHLKGITSLQSWWERDLNSIEAYEEIIAQQLIAKGIFSNRIEFQNLKTIRLKNIPVDISPDVDFLVFTALNELLQMEEEKKLEASDVAHFNINGTFQSALTRKTSTIYRVLLEELAEKEILFPVPTTLDDVIHLRHDKEVEKFREIFKLWMKNISSVNIEEEERLRKEIKIFSFKSRTHGQLSSISRFVGFLSIPLGLLPDFTIPGFLLSIGTFGMDKLAARWAGETSWLSFGSNS
jgi:hypothetical protein